MSRRKNSPVTVESIRRDVAAWVVQDGEGDGAWNMFILHTVKDMMQDYAVTFQYLSQITKEQFDFVCEAMDEVDLCMEAFTSTKDRKSSYRQMMASRSFFKRDED
jgi:hypothetical protein